MAEPIVAGIAGLVVGGLVTGASQLILGQIERNRDARSAARLLFMKLYTANEAVEYLEEHREWTPPGLDFGQFMVAWEKRSDALSRVLTSGDAIRVDVAFALLDMLAAGKAEDEAEATRSGDAIGFQFGSDVLSRVRATVQAARLIVYRAAFTKREIRRGEVPPLEELESEAKGAQEPSEPATADDD